MRIIFYKRKAVSLFVIVISVFTLFALAGLAIDAGYVFNCQNELQKALETTALAGASSIEPTTDSSGTTSLPSEDTVKQAMKDTINIIAKNNSMLNAHLDEITSYSAIDVKRSSKAARISSQMTVNTFFIAVIGLNKVTITAHAAAMGCPSYLSKIFPTSPYDGAKISFQPRVPVGLNKGFTANQNIDNIYGAPDGKGVSLGPGGMVVLRMPMSIINGSGADFAINTLGNSKGYYVLAGIDANPNGAFISTSNPGAGIYWQNVSCTGTSTSITSDPNSMIGAYNVVEHVGPYDFNYDAKFYGSGIFDLGRDCGGGSNNYHGGLSSAQYLMIIDDNIEDGFVADNPSKPVLLLGDHSSITPGVTIDAISVFHHSRLIAYNDLDVDSDKDGLIDVLENMLGTSNAPTVAEYIGWYYNGASINTLLDGPSKVVYYTPQTDSNKSSDGTYQSKITLEK